MMAEAAEFTFVGPKALKLHGRHWKKTGACGTVIGVHGYSEHSGSYSHFAEFLNQKNLEVLWLDLPGHGLSEGKRSDVDDFSEYVLSYENLVKEAEKRACPKPYFGFAHSLGSLVFIRFLQTSALSSSIKRGVVSSPLLGLAEFPPPVLPFLGLLTHILPNFSWVSGKAMAAEKLTHDKIMQDRRANDKLIVSRVTIHWFREFVKARKKAFAEVGGIRTPLGLFQGGLDQVTDSREAVRFFSQLSSPKLQKVYPAMAHEVVNEVNRAQVMEDMWKWLEQGL